MEAAITDIEFFNIKMQQNEELRTAKTHKVRKGDSLWNIAKEELGKDAKKSDILDYMYKIAKHNHYDSPQKMNSLKINDTIALPETKSSLKDKKDNQQKVQPPKDKEQKTKIRETKAATVPETKQAVDLTAKSEPFQLFKWENEGSFLMDNFVKQREINIPFESKTRIEKKQPVNKSVKVIHKKKAKEQFVMPKAKNNAEAGFYNVCNEIINNPQNNIIECTQGTIPIENVTGCVYHIDSRKDKYSKQKHLCSFDVNVNKQITSISFNGKNIVLDLKLDYDIDSSGHITQTNIYYTETKSISTVDKALFDKLAKILLQKVNQEQENIQ